MSILNEQDKEMLELGKKALEATYKTLTPEEQEDYKVLLTYNRVLATHDPEYMAQQLAMHSVKVESLRKLVAFYEQRGEVVLGTIN